MLNTYCDTTLEELFDTTEKPNSMEYIKHAFNILVKFGGPQKLILFLFICWTYRLNIKLAYLFKYLTYDF